MLLGGQWTKLAPGYRPEVEDPIYAIFAMLEAVRLVEPDHGGCCANSKTTVSCQ
jgi:hypothetical protein